MNIIRIYFFIRSSQTIAEYERKTGKVFWNELSEKLSEKLTKGESMPQIGNKYQRMFFLLAENNSDHYLHAATNILEEVLGDKELYSKVNIVADEPNKKTLDTLLSGDRKGGNPKFWEEAKKASAATDDSAQKPQTASEPKNSSDPSKNSEKNNTPKSPTEGKSANAGTSSTTAVNAPAKESSESSGEHTESADEYKPISDRIEKINDLREGLLDKIKGQRHAVEEMVETIFECEMFASQNPDRKGPLASFLFTGPSGVGKTYLANTCAKLLDRPSLVVDMSEYSDNLSNNKFNGDHGQPATVTGFVRKNPNGIIIFDEVEKAHINTIHLFLQILDAGRLMDCQIRQEVSFADTIIIMTTNAGKDLYDDATVCDLSSTPRSVILDGLRNDINPQTGEPFFPECITTRMANGHVILFNHLDPYSLMEIVCKEIALQIKLFEKSSKVKIKLDEKMLSALIIYHSGGVSDARTLRGLAKNIVVRELQEIVSQLYNKYEKKALNSLSEIQITVNTSADPEINKLFTNSQLMQVTAFTNGFSEAVKKAAQQNNTLFHATDNINEFKRLARGLTDYILIDPLTGIESMEEIPNDIEDIHSDGMDMFDYARDYLPDVPVYIIDKFPQKNNSFDTLISRGARGVIPINNANPNGLGKILKELSFGTLINNNAYALGRSGKYLHFNCAQYINSISDVTISFEKLKLKSAPRAEDAGMIAQKGENNNLKFSDLIGCKHAKETLSEFCAALDNPRLVAMKGKKMPKGVLLYGPPGTGKTMLAKAMANECNATFFPISSTTFFGSYVGETERNIRNLFKKARKYAPSIIFIDEVDAIGRMRTGSSSTHHNEDALNAFLAEMDGFTTDEKRPVFILAATNYDLDGNSGRVLDPAFVRRFDSKILIPLPDTDDRYALLNMCLSKHGIHFGERHEKLLRNMAERTGGMNNADISMMVAQFVRAIGDRKPTPEQFMDNLDQFRFGEINKMNAENLRQTACHEAGHALVCKLCGTTPSFLTVVSRGSFGGFMESAGEKDKSTYTQRELMNLVCRALAGRVAEIILYGEESGINTGASSDIEHAKYYIKKAISDFAMGNRFFVTDIDEEAETLIRQQYSRTFEMLKNNKNILISLTDLLVKKKSLDKTAMESFFKYHGLQ